MQAVVGITAFVVGLLSIPGVSEFLSQQPILANVSLATVIGIITYLQNAIEDYLKK